MDIKNILLITELALGVIFVALILIQPKASGGLTRSWGSSTSFTRRGVERMIFRLTFIIAGIFILVSASQLFL